MRLAVISDIHGNLPAFEAVLKHIAGHKVDQIVIAGDIVIGCPDSVDCWHLAHSLGCPILRGNHERYLADFGTPNASPAWSTRQYGPLHLAVSQFTDSDRQRMQKLPTTVRLSGAPDVFLVHASERNDTDTVAAYTPGAELSAMFPRTQERFIVRGHNHIGQVRLWGNRTIVTNGSAGLPLDGNPGAQYLLLDRQEHDWHVQHQVVEYDLDAVLKRFHDTNYVASTGPIGRLFRREVITASQQIIPFFRLYATALNQGDISLDEAVETYLNRY